MRNVYTSAYFHVCHPNVSFHFFSSLFHFIKLCFRFDGAAEINIKNKENDAAEEAEDVGRNVLTFSDDRRLPTSTIKCVCFTGVFGCEGEHTHYVEHVTTASIDI